MARIDHTNCNHPRTAAARKICRAANKTAAPVVAVIAPVTPAPVVRRPLLNGTGMVFKGADMTSRTY